MSEHRRKPPQSPGGGRAAARRGAGQQPSPPPSSGGHRAAPRSPEPPPPGGGFGGGRSLGGRAEARRAAQGGRRRAGNAAEDIGGAGHGGGRRGRGGGSGPGGGGPGRRAGRGPSRPPKKRFIDYPRWGRTGWRRWVPSWKQVTTLCIVFIGSLVGIAGLAYAMVQVPDVNKTAKAQNNVYYWADGTRMVATGGEINRQIVGIEKIPKAMQYAVISAENKTFETDSGVDPMGIARAVFNMAQGGETQGGSTITQQYVKNSRLDQSQTITRKFKELFISIKVGATMHKDDIMAGYLNTSYFGRGAYGIQAAAQTYFGVDSDKLNPSQCAFLAALLKGPTYFDPAGATSIDPTATPEANQKRSVERWGWILDQEVKYGHMAAADRAKLTYPKPLTIKKNAQLSGQYGYLVDLATRNVLNQTQTKITPGDLARGGYQIHTTFDKKKVNELENTIKGVQAKNIKPQERPDHDKFVQFGASSVEPSTGKIVAIYGGSNATEHYTDNADETGAQVGSTFKPFVLAAAMTYGVRDPSGPPDQPQSMRRIVSQKAVYNGKNNLKIKSYNGQVWQNEQGQEWLQENDGHDSYGNITLRDAMAYSVNSPYVQLGMDVGTEKVKDAALAAGLRENSLAGWKDTPSFSLGTSDPSAIRMAGAYGTFAQHGVQRDPYAVTSVDKDGTQVYKHEDKAKQAFSQAVADNVTDVLANVVAKGTGTAAQLDDGRPVAGKTGTTDNNRSAWFVGYTPQLSTSVVMFRRDDKSEVDKDGKQIVKPFLDMYGTGGQKKIHGASFPAEIWHDYMTQALQGTQIMQFEQPPADFGEPVYGGGAQSPTPTPSVTPSKSAKPSTTPSTSTSPTQSTSPTPTPTDTCKPWDFTCTQPAGGTTNGGNTGSPSPTATGPGRGKGGATGG